VDAAGVEAGEGYAERAPTSAWNLPVQASLLFDALDVAGHADGDGTNGRGGLAA